MIENNQLTISNTGGILQSVRIDNKILNPLVLAVLTTIIAYQGKAVFFDLVLGLKKRGVMSIQDLHIFLLSGESSPLAVLDALLRKDWLTRKRLRGDVPKQTTIHRDQKRIRPATCFRLLFLLVIGPAVNIIAISLTLGRDRQYTIAEAGLGGFQVGINKNLETITTEADSQFCRKVPIDLHEGDTSLSTFFLCRNIVLAEDTEDRVAPGTAVVSGFLNLKGSIHVVIHSDIDSVVLFVNGNLRSNGTVYYIKPTLTYDELIQLTEIGAKVIRSACGATGIETPRNASQGEKLRVERFIDCPNGFTFGERSLGLAAMQQVITFKDAPNLEVVPYLEIPFLENRTTQYYLADPLPLIRRTRGTASLLILLITAASIVVLRMLVRLFAYNDFPVAIEIVLRDRFGLPCCDSMLQNDTPVEYRKSFQLVENGHFGMSSDSLPEVDKFAGGSVE